ncbi:MAG: NAD(+)/NADH kinase [Acidobacteria bacterium]|nr:NAD(+)/NADH kinase [Acidobacteriota bacterium]
MTRIQDVAVVAKKDSERAAATSAEVKRWLEERGVVVVVPESAPADLVVVLGGDGTLLSVARNRPGVPIVGVNLGTLGYLAEIGRERLYANLGTILEGGFEVEERLLLDVELEHETGGRTRYRALNDAVVHKSALARMIHLEVEIDGEPVAVYRTDGLIVSTPTGSTAYSLSAGGPILYPTLPVVLLTPISPHTLSMRPVVVPETSTIAMTLGSRDEEVYLTLDGQEGTRLMGGDRVVVTVSESKALLARVDGQTHYDALRSKLGWGE